MKRTKKKNRPDSDLQAALAGALGFSGMALEKTRSPRKVDRFGF